MARRSAAILTAYVYDLSPENPLAHDDIALEYRDGILTRRWMHSDTVDEPVGFEEYTVSSGVGSGTEHALYADRQGSVIWVTEPATGQVVAGYEYDGYGQLTQTAGTLSQPYGYTGREYDAESGLYYYRARAYDPAAGVFVQSDPIGFRGGYENVYSYVGQDTFSNSDPTGLTTEAAPLRPRFGTSLGEFFAIAGAAARNAVIASGEVAAGMIQLASRVAAAISRMDIVFSQSSDDNDKENDCSSSDGSPLDLEVDDLGKLKNSDFDVPGTAGPTEIVRAIGIVMNSIRQRESEQRYFELRYGKDDQYYRHDARIKKERSLLNDLEGRYKNQGRGDC
ncbi:MAG: RHS repeat-associated core domain-containing protein [Rhodobacteraceae bacterium]|nr:RHS repeat-associated core domain-containing protein [Paracoccaceae bacterium]